MTQSYANHRRMDPWYHYVALSLWVVCIASTVHHLFQHRPGARTDLLLLFLIIILLLKVRTYALRVQDRVIRLEETLRMKAILPEAMQAEVHRLKPAQFVGLRFAADAELAARAEEALREDLSGEAIKKRIQTWRPDEFRV